MVSVKYIRYCAGEVCTKVFGQSKKSLRQEIGYLQNELNVTKNKLLKERELLAAQEKEKIALKNAELRQRGWNSLCQIIERIGDSQPKVDLALKRLSLNEHTPDDIKLLKEHGQNLKLYWLRLSKEPHLWDRQVEFCAQKKINLSGTSFSSVKQKFNNYHFEHKNNDFSQHDVEIAKSYNEKLTNGERILSDIYPGTKIAELNKEFSKRYYENYYPKSYELRDKAHQNNFMLIG